jgi:hypothetical protein
VASSNKLLCEFKVFCSNIVFLIFLNTLVGPWFQQGCCSVNDSQNVTISKDALHD